MFVEDFAHYLAHRKLSLIDSYYCGNNRAHTFKPDLEESLLCFTTLTCVALRKTLNFPVPQFLHLWNKDYNNEEVTICKGPKQHLLCNKCCTSDSY
jgi:hypothetical protein